MTVSRATVLATLAPDEIDYPRAADLLGPEALPVLAEIVAEADPALAPKAAYLAAAIADRAPAAPVELLRVAQSAAASADPVIRIAGADLASRLAPDAAPALVTALLEDPDVGVRKHALAAAGQFREVPEIRRSLQDRVVAEPEPALRQTAEGYIG